MLKNYVVIGWRNLWKNETVSLTNILGLVIGMVSCLLIWQYVSSELSYDKFHKNNHLLYRITSQHSYDDNPYESALSTFNIGPALKRNFPEVKQFVRLHPYSQIQFSCALMYKAGTGVTRIFNEPNLFYADASFFSVFSFPLTQGQSHTVLQDPYSAVISETVAKKYFGNDYPLGKVLTLNSSSQNADYVVTGVMKDIPENSHIKPEIVLSIKSLPDFGENSDFYTYILLDESATYDNLSEKLALFNKERPRSSDDLVSFNSQAIKDIHLYSDTLDEAQPGGSSEIVYFLAVLAFLIMTLAWINYLNLTTARYLERIKEFGLRKISGANFYQLIKQCFVETFLILLVSTVMALVIRHMIFYSDLAKAHLFGNEFIIVNGAPWLVIIVFFCFGIVFAVYQALFLSSFRLTSVLKGRFTGTTKGSWLRKTLVVFQFTISVCLVIGIFTLHNQFKYMLDQELGIDLEQKIVVKTPSNVDSTYITKLTSFKNELRKVANIDNVTTSSMVPGLDNDWFVEVRKQNERKEAYRNLAVYVLDSDFFDVYGLSIVAGRGFLPEDQPGARFGNKLENVIINEKASRALGFKAYEEAVDQIVFWNDIKCRIIGVVKNFHQQSLRYAIQPAIFTVNNRDSIFYTISLNTYTSDPTKAEQALTWTLSLIRQNWSRFFPDNPFEFYLLKDAFDDQYQPDRKLAKTLGLFSVLAIFIACLGLFGLSAYSTAQRKREIGIRKVLGASASGIVRLISGDFFTLIALAGMLAVPVAYFGIRRWLAYYAYTVDISWWFFAVPLIIVVLVAMATVGFHTIRASLGNPVDALKYE